MTLFVPTCFKPSLMSITIASCLLPGQLLAQEAGRARAGVDEVVITASPVRSDRNYQAVNTYNEEQVFEMTALSLGEMLDGEPGLSARSFGGAPARPVIRGFDGERLLILENGERMGDIQSTAPDHAVTLDPLGMSRIEVVRGPASLLYGSSALGGVINIFTEDFASDWSPGVSGGLSAVGASNNDSLSGSGALTMGNEHSAVTVRHQQRSNSDARTPSGTLPNSQLNSWTSSLGYAFRRDNFRGGIAFRYFDSDYGIPEFASLADPDNPGRFKEVEPDMEIRINRWNVQARGIWDFDGFFNELQARMNLSGSEQEEGEPNPTPETLELGIRTRTLSATVLLSHGPLAFFDAGVIGTQVHRRNQRVDGLEAYFPGDELTNIALFTMQEGLLTDRLSIQGGFRLEYEQLAGAENRFFANEDLVDDRFYNLAASLGLGWQHNDEWRFSAQLSRAHRNPTVLERYADGWHAGATRIELGDPSLSSEIGYGLDLIAHYDNGPLSVEFAAFYNRIDNFVALRTLEAGCGGLSYRVQPDRQFPNCVQFFAADAEQMGVELIANWQLQEHLLLTFMSDYVQGNRRDINEPLPFMPPMRTTLGLHYDNIRWRFGGSLRHVPSQTRVPDYELPTDGYTLLRLEGSYRFDTQAGEHVLNLRVDNALDTSYQDHMSVVRRFRDPVLGPEAPSRFDMPGRNITLSYRFLF